MEQVSNSHFRKAGAIKIVARVICIPVVLASGLSIKMIHDAPTFEMFFFLLYCLVFVYLAGSIIIRPIERINPYWAYRKILLTLFLFIVPMIWLFLMFSGMAGIN
jgi:hypothetical protein